MPLRWRILGAFFVIVLFTILLSTGFEFWTTEQKLNEFTTRIKTDDLAGVLSRQYTIDKSWIDIEQTLIQAGLYYSESEIKEVEEKGVKFSELMPWHVIVRDAAGSIVADNYAQLTNNNSMPQAGSESVAISDLDTGQVVGSVTVNINRVYINAVLSSFLLSVVYPRALQGLVTLIIALLLVVWLSRRITAPVRTLTQAMQSIIKSGKTSLLPVKSSDELGQMSVAFNKMTTALQTQRDLRKRLIDDVSHELNTPLTVILLEAKGLLDEMQTPKDAATHIIQEVDMLRNLVYDLNWLAETDSGELQLNLESCPLDVFLEKEVERWQLQFQMAGIDLVLMDLPGDLPNIQMDTVRMSQALGNLIHNALQHSATGGRVTVQCTLANGWVAIAVSDTGSGIAPEDLPFIFERFYRAEASRQKDISGRGLGLSIVKQIAEAHGGQVLVESQLGRGSCFYLRLPVGKS